MIETEAKQTRSHKGLVKKKIQVKRGGKTFERYQWVKSTEDTPESKKSKEVDEKVGKSKYNPMDKIHFMGDDLVIMKVSETQKTVKLSNGKVYTFDAIEKGSKPKEEIKKEPPKKKTSIKDLKVKLGEKEIKRKIPVGTLVTEENAEETLKIGSKIEFRGNLFTVSNRNSSIVSIMDQSGDVEINSIKGLIEVKAKTRKSDTVDVKLNKKVDKKRNLAQKKIENREKRFTKEIESKQIGAESGIKKPEIGDSVEITFGRKSKIENITSEGVTIDGSIYDHEEVYEALNDGKFLVTGEKATGNYNFTNDKDQDEKISKTINKLDNLMLDGKSLSDAVKEVVGGEEKTITSDINSQDFPKNSIIYIKDAIKITNKYISPKYKESGLNIKIIGNTTGRSYAISERNEISLVDNYDIESTLMHEIGHIMENNHGDNHQVIDDFLRSRTSNLSNQEKLDDLFPGVGYRDDEIVSKDDFIDPYVGKVYYKNANKNEIDTHDLRSSEVLSMGIQKFNEEDTMRNFYIMDKSHFALTLSIMAGDFL